MRNRDGVEYSFKKLDDCTYTIVGDLKYWRFGGRDGQSVMDESNLGFVDPAGGPFVSVGSNINGEEIVNISAHNFREDSVVILFKVK